MLNFIKKNVDLLAFIFFIDNRSIGNLGSGSDYTVFSHILGVPSVDMYYNYQEVA